MIVARIIGGLGNQMFEYAMARAISLRVNVDFKLDVSGFDDYGLRTYDLDCFQVVQNIAKQREYIIGEPQSWKGRLKKWLGISTQLEYYKEESTVFDANAYALNNNVYLDGYWQSARYFSDAEEQIRADFKFKTPPDTLNQACLDHIKAVDAVAVHIRRGDYVSNPEANAVHGLCDLDYYQRAAEFIRANTSSGQLHFFVFSDDPAWVRENLDLGGNATFVSHNNESNSYEDMRLMSACRHNIIANSSFSWWGAWLNPSPEKIVIAPKQWFRSQHDATDLIPPEWIRL